jgi:hypothetical protein
VLHASQTELAKYVSIGTKYVSDKTYGGNSTQILYPADSSASRPVFDIINIRRVNAPLFYCTRVKFQHITFVAVHQTEENKLNESTTLIQQHAMENNEHMRVGLYRHKLLQWIKVK